MKIHVFMIVFVTVLGMAGCGTATSNVDQLIAAVSEPSRTTTSIAVPEIELLAAAPQVAVPGDVEEAVPNGNIDWSGNSVRATGTGVVDTSNPNIAQARLMAERAAVVVAQRNLLEIIKGVQIDSETRVENFMTDYDVIYSRVEGTVRNARQVGPSKYDSITGVVEVELEMEIHSSRGLSGALSSALNNEDIDTAAAMSPQVRSFLNQYSGLVFDGGDAGLKPSMYPKIYDEDGNLLLDTKNYTSYLGSAGESAMQFISDLDQVLSQPAFAQSPLVLNVRRVTGQFGSDIILSNSDAGEFGLIKDGLPFLMDAGRFLLRVLL